MLHSRVRPHTLARDRLRALIVIGLLMTACSSPLPAFTDLPPGDATHGAMLFSQTLNGAPSCANCHSLDGSILVGPTLKQVAIIAGTRVAGLSAGEYLYQSIISPAAYIVSGYSNEMYAQYGRELSPQQLADLVAYLLTLRH
ncbi:MAG: c-type cytochrome [Aggregatilineales bacterium]